MANIEDKIEQYFLENIEILKKLNKLLVRDVTNGRHILSDRVYEFVTLLLSNNTSFSLLRKMLDEYIYNLSISKTEKEYFISKLYDHLGKIGGQPYIDLPDSVDNKSLIAFDRELHYSISGFLLGFINFSDPVDSEFRSQCAESIRERSEVMTILFVKKHINKFSPNHQKEVSSIIKKYLRRKISVNLAYPIIDFYYFLMLTSKEDFELKIGRESITKNISSDLIEICTRVLERNQEGKKEDEINDYVSDLLRSKSYNVSDQTRSGLSMSKLNSGEIDLMIRDKRGLPVTIIECLKINSVSARGKNKNLVNHLTKLLDNYDGLGLSNKHLLIYCFANDFEKFKSNYRFFLAITMKEEASNILQLDSVGNIRNPYGEDVSNLACIYTFHRINGVYQKITHYLMRLKKQK